jgi:phosphatidylglycerophosphate synthase
VLVADASAVLSDSAVLWLLENVGQALTTPSGRAVAVAVDECEAQAMRARLERGQVPNSLNPAQMPDMFIRKLRRRDKLLVRSLAEEPPAKLERTLFASVYKGVTDIVTKHVWPIPAFWATKFCSIVGISPNMVTMAGILLMVVAACCWTVGWLWTGLLAAWVMTFFDTVDGKLARVTSTSSRFGDKLDHATDIFHPPIWWVCLAIGLAQWVPAASETIWLACAAILVTYVLGRMIEVMFKVNIGYNPFLWQRFDSTFRLIVSRRNIILLIMTAGLALRMPVEAFVVGAVWSVISVAVQAVRYAQALRAARRGNAQSWLM